MMPHLRSIIASLRASIAMAGAAIDRAREQVADLVPDQMIFTNNGTEAGNFAINGIAARTVLLRQLRHVCGRAVG
jgi:cysteine sulfinate desulfinase/cysteine desulfurase-like protein